MIHWQEASPTTLCARGVPIFTIRAGRGLLAMVSLAYALTLAVAPLSHGADLAERGVGDGSGRVVEAPPEGPPSDSHSHDGPFCLTCHALSVSVSPPAGLSIPSAPVRVTGLDQATAFLRPAASAHPLRARAPPGVS